MTTTARSRFPAAIVVISAMVLSMLIATSRPAVGGHNPVISISQNAYVQGTLTQTECPCEEGAQGTTTTFNFDVTLRDPQTGLPVTPHPGETITIDYATSERTADEGVDYEGASDTLVFSGSTSRQTISIGVIGDDVDEGDIEYFDVFIFDLQGGARLGNDVGEGGILDDDPAADPAIVIDDYTDFEGDSGTTTFTFTVRFLNPSGTHTLEYDTQPGTATATDQDYTPKVGTVTVSETTPTAAIDVTVNGDENVEPDENFFVKISGIDAPIIDDTGEGTILSEERPTPKLTIDDVAGSEGDSGTRDFTFTVELDRVVENEITVKYQTRDATANADDNDYESNNGTARIPAGELWTSVTVTVNGDTKRERDETFLVRLSEPQGAELADTTGEGVILTEEPSLSVSDAFVEEPEEGTNGASFTVRLSDAVEWKITIDYETEDGTATAGEDYEAESGTLTFEAGQTSEQIVIDVHADDEDEGSETFFVNLLNVDGADIDDGRGEGQIGGAVVADAGQDKTGESARNVAFMGSASDGSGDYTFTWDFGDGTAKQTGAAVKHRFAETGTFTVTLTVKDNSSGDKSTDTSRVVITDSGRVERSFGDNREGTAIDVSRDHWDQADTVLLATGYAHADALAAGPLAKRLDAPLLLTNPHGVPDEVKDELDRLGASQVIILGGVHAVPQSQADELAREGYRVRRIADINRFGTAADIATEVGATSAKEVTVSLGQHADENRDDWPDALSAGSFASLAQPLPSLLTHSSTVPQETLDALAELDTRKVFLLGGSVAISDRVEQQLEAEGYGVQRVFGADRYGTSVAAGEIVMARYPAGQHHPVLATGRKFPDGLTGGALAGKVRGPVVLVPSDDLDNAPSVREFLRKYANPFDVGTIVGGEAVVSNDVQTQARSDMDSF